MSPDEIAQWIGPAMQRYLERPAVEISSGLFRYGDSPISVEKGSPAGMIP